MLQRDYKEGISKHRLGSKYADVGRVFGSLTRRGLKDFPFPRSKDKLTKPIITCKLKAIRVKYHQAVDTGR